MMYPFLTLDDQTEIVHSEMKPDGRVKVYVESRMKKTSSTTPSVGFPATSGSRSMDLRRRSWTGMSRSFALRIVGDRSCFYRRWAKEMPGVTLRPGFSCFYVLKLRLLP